MPIFCFLKCYIFVSTLRFSVSYPSINKHASNACFFVFIFFSLPNNKGLLRLLTQLSKIISKYFLSIQRSCSVKLKLLNSLLGRVKRLLFLSRVDTEKFSKDPFEVHDLVSCLNIAKSVQIAAATRVSYIGAPETELRA